MTIARDAFAIERRSFGGRRLRTLAGFAYRHSVLISAAAGIVVAVLLRAPWFDAALGRDEGGDALVAQRWSDDGTTPYGDLFLDRPPLLLLLYRLAALDGATGIRILGAVAAALLVGVTTLLAVRLGGRRAAPAAAAICAALASSFILAAVFTPAELLAAVPSAASVLVLVTAIERERHRLWMFAAAGALALAALLVKQSFVDALAAGAVGIAAARFTGSGWRETGRRAAAYAAGAAVLALPVVVWQVVHATHTTLFYSMFGFRLDAVHALTNNGLGPKLSHLGSLAWRSGLAVGTVLAVAGIFRVWRGRPALGAVLSAWLLASLVGILGGGSYWPHYLIALVPVAAAGTATLVAPWRSAVALVACAAVLVTGVTAMRTVRYDGADALNHQAVAVGSYLRAHAEPGQTDYVLYAKANILYYSGLRPAFPLDWSLMMRAVPHAQAQLRHLLASPRRPTWVVAQQGTHGFKLDKDGRTAALLARHYRRFATVAGDPILLARGATARS